jgi:hypothetical protein
MSVYYIGDSVSLIVLTRYHFNLESELESELSDPAADSESLSEEDRRAKWAATEADFRTRLTNEEVNKWLQNTKVKFCSSNLGKSRH